MFGKRSVRIVLKPTTITVALIGAALMTYLSRLHYIYGTSSVCDFGEGLSCDVVNHSAYSELLGIPVAILGLIYFLSVIYLLVVKPLKQPYRVILLASVFSLVFGLYLSGIEQFVLNSICLFCEVSKLAMIGLIWLSVLGVKKHKEKMSVYWVIGAVAAGVIFSWAAYSIT